MKTDAGLEPCRLLAWDSEFFGVRVARLDDRTLDDERAARALEWCDRQKVDCLYFLADAGDAETVRAAQRSGFGLVDIRVTLARPLDADQADAGLAEAVRAARPEDVGPLAAIAREAHADSRFYFDGRFPRERCADLYATWIERSCAGWADAVLVADHEGRAAGYITCQVAGTSGRIGLVGVAPEARGRGIGRRLVRGALGWFAARPADRVEVVTQGRNVAAQALYQQHGFRTHRVELWYHRWLTPPQARP